MENPQLPTIPGYIREKAYLATAAPELLVLPAGLAPVSEEGVLCPFAQRNKICRGDAAELLSPGRLGVSVTIRQLYDAQGTPIESAPHPYQKFFTRLPFPVREGDILRAAPDSTRLRRLKY